MTKLILLALCGVFLTTSLMAPYAKATPMAIANDAFKEYEELRTDLEKVISPKKKKYLQNLNDAFKKVNDGVTSLQALLGAYAIFKTTLSGAADRAEKLAELTNDLMLGKSVHTDGVVITGSDFQFRYDGAVLSPKDALESISDAQEELKDLQEDMQDSKADLLKQVSENSPAVLALNSYIAKIGRMVFLLGDLNKDFEYQIQSIRSAIGRTEAESQQIMKNIEYALEHINAAKKEIVEARKFLKKAGEIRK